MPVVNSKPVPYLNHGFVRLVEYMGSDEIIEEATRQSNGLGTRPVNDRRNLLRYIIRHRHTSPIEMGEVHLHMKIPIFVCRQLIRHRTASINEYSGRYSIMPDEFYIPESKYMRPQSSTNKQGSAPKPLDAAVAEAIGEEMGAFNRRAYELYESLLNDSKLARETSRIVLPVSVFTELHWKIDLKNLFHFLRLRVDRDHAQSEIADLAQIIYDIVRPLFPLCFEAWEDYELNAVTFSRMEMDILRELLSRIPHDDIEAAIAANSELSKREADEMRKKLRGSSPP